MCEAEGPCQMEGDPRFGNSPRRPEDGGKGRGGVGTGVAIRLATDNRSAGRSLKALCFQGLGSFVRRIVVASHIAFDANPLKSKGFTVDVHRLAFSVTG